MKQVLGLGLLLCALGAGANDKPNKIELEHDYYQAAKFKDSQGKLNLNVTKLAFSNRYVQLGYQHWGIHSDSVAGLPFGDGVNQPITRLHSLNVGTGYMMRLSEDSRWLNRISLGLHYEKEIDDATNVNLLSMWMKSLTPDLELIAGASYGYHPVHSKLLPVIGLSYRAQAQEGWGATLGYPRSFVSYGFSPRWQWSSGVAYQRLVARLAKDSKIEAAGYAEIRNWQGDMRLTYRPNAQWQVFTSVRYIPFYEFETYNRRGHSLTTYSLEPTWGAGVGVRYQF
ncbi:MAG: hypothetical protein RBS36_02480 [Thiomicrospira sp.]|jgi:hypothetical protein|nr:hypothetical protein [Thiomicrospira sp.]